MVITKGEDAKETLNVLCGRKQVSDPLRIDIFSNVLLYYRSFSPN